MALDVGLSDSRWGVAFQARGVIQLEDDGFYWALDRYLCNVPSSTGKAIDLYGDAAYDPTLIPAFRAALAQARVAYMSGPPVLAIHTGTQVHPVRREGFESIDRQELLTLIAKLDALAQQASEEQLYLVFRGD